MVTYPFIPKTTSKVQVGDFWAIRLDDGRYAAGRVLQLLDRVTVLGCILDWSSDKPPSVESIAGARIAEAGKMHLPLTVMDCGEGILGNRALELDEIDLPLFRSHSHGPGQLLLEGATNVGSASKEDQNLPTLTTWGFAYARLRANRRFCPRA